MRTKTLYEYKFANGTVMITYKMSGDEKHMYERQNGKLLLVKKVL